MSNIIGKTFLNQFRVDSFLASGGMGAVYRIWDIQRNTFLAMKVLHIDPLEDPTAFKYFKREARALQNLTHPNIVPFYGLYHSEDITFMLEYFVDGPNLKDILRISKDQPLPLETVLTLIKALSSALGYAHSNNVIHCDVKPGNVMMDGFGNIFLADFGIARHADSTTTTMNGAGTPSYMAPEQIRGEPVSTETDIYALGILLFEMVTGRRPFLGDAYNEQRTTSSTMERIRSEHLKSPAPDPRKYNLKISEELSRVILKALQKLPSERYPDTLSFFYALCEACKIAPGQIPDRVTLDTQETSKLIISEGKEIVGQTPPKGTAMFWVIGAVALLTGFFVFSGFFRPAYTFTSALNQPAEGLTSTRMSDPTKMINTSTPQPLPSQAPTDSPTLSPTPTEDPICSDADRIELYVGAPGRVKQNQTTMLENPASLKDKDYKLIRYLRERERILVMAGPICFNGDTWWKIKTESSNEGWSLELGPSGNRLLSLDR